MRAAFVFAPDRCTGCEACRIACGIENGEGQDTGWRTVSTFNPARHPALPTRHLSLACNHCDTPACAIGCPASAYERDEQTGAVLLQPDKCIGCRYCSWLCPYDAPKFDADRGVMTKCTFCAPRLAAGGQPACTAACPTGALSLGSRETGAPEPSYHGLADFGLGPSLRVEKTRLEGPPPALAIDALVYGAPVQARPERRITLASEWALLLFTIVMPALVAWLGAGIVHAARRPRLVPFLGLAALAVALSTLHLGRPLRAWRAVLNVRTSWLSREIVFTNLFVALGLAFLALPHAPGALGAAAAVSGVALAVSIDGVYRAIPRPDAGAMQSAEAVPTLLLLFGLAAGVPLIAVAAALLKGALYSWQWIRGEAGAPAPLAAARIAFLAAAFLPFLPWTLAFASALLGEVIDRAGFYNRLEPSSPGLLMAREAAAAGR